MVAFLNPEKSCGFIPRFLKVASDEAVGVGVLFPLDFSFTVIVTESETFVAFESLLPVTFPLKFTLYTPAFVGVKVVFSVFLVSSASLV